MAWVCASAIRDAISAMVLAWLAFNAEPTLILSMETVSAILDIPITVEFAQNVLRVHCGAQLSINASMSVAKIQLILPLPKHVFATLALACSVVHAKHALLITSFLMDTV